jgi:hypothetical protein
MIRIICIIAFLSIFCNCSAQIEKDNFYAGKALTLRTNPFSFFQTDAGIIIGINYRWQQRWSATLDPKFIFYAVQPSDNGTDTRSPLGVRVKLDIRYHIQNFLFGFENIFIAPEAVFGYTRTKSTAEFGMNCTGGNCAYYMIDQYTEIKKEAGGAIKIGMIGPIKKNNEKWKLELYAGLGVSFFDFEQTGIPPGGSFVIPPTHEDGLGTLDESEPNVMIPFGLIITYRIK